ncbi:50S ribosomal protein L23 [archaeon]|nr:MAG: 50S ribosomal protein L23 [archaeon]
MPAEVWNIISHSLLTEKSISFVESQNKLVFIVRRNSNKNGIKWAVEKAFEVKVDEVKTLIDQKGRKKAFVKLDKNFNAGEIATRLGML